MSQSSRPLSLPTPGDLRSCTRWACLQRVPATGPDPAPLMHLVDRVVHDVAAVMVLDAEVHARPKAFDEYEGRFLDQFWAAVPYLPDPLYPQSLLAAVEHRGAVCLEQLAAPILPRLMARERLLLHDQSFVWTIPNGRGGTLSLAGRIARVAEDRESGVLRLYDWRIEDYDALDWTDHIRHQRLGMAVGWLRAVHPDREIRVETVHLASDIISESTWSAEDLRGLQIICQAQAMLADPETARRAFGPPPVVLGKN